MASNLRVDSIVPATGGSVSIGTATGGVNIPGVLTYEDVTNVDSIGIITARTDINLGDSIIHIGDTDTKIRFPGNDQVSIETAGSERIRIQSDGDVGIGTINNTNNERLRVQDDASTSTVCQVSIISGSAERSILNFGDKEDPNIGRVSYHNNTNTLSLFTNNTERLLINSDGVVTKPNTPAFHVSRQGGDVSNNNYVIFDHVDYNNGNHYNNSNGRFTAPVTGIYFFSAWHFTNSTSAFYLRINGTTFGEYTWDDTGGCGTWVCPMTVNQYAQIYTKYNWRGSADYHNAFCGYLIG